MTRPGDLYGHPAIPGRRARDCDPAAGYLLVEALATLAISAVILVGLASLIRVALMASDRTAAKAQTIEVTGRTLDALARDLRFLTNARWAGAGADGMPGFAFAGSAETIVLTQDVRQPDGLRATTVVALQAMRSGDETRLLRAEGPMIPGTRGPTDIRFGPGEEVYRGPLQVTFGYQAREPDATLGPVLQDWADPSDVPAAIQVSLIDMHDASRTAIRTVMPEINAEAGCLLPRVFVCRDKQPLQASEGADITASGASSVGQ